MGEEYRSSRLPEGVGRKVRVVSMGAGGGPVGFEAAYESLCCDIGTWIQRVQTAVMLRQVMADASFYVSLSRAEQAGDGDDRVDRFLLQDVEAHCCSDVTPGGNITPTKRHPTIVALR